MLLALYACSRCSCGRWSPRCTDALASSLVVAAALGLAVYVVQDLSWGEITYYVPFAAAVLLVALGSDYTMFLAGRVWGGRAHAAVARGDRRGRRRAATAIAVAGEPARSDFAVLVLVPLRPFRELAFTMAAGLLIDAFVVRTLLVPALISSSGRRARMAEPAPRDAPRLATRAGGAARAAAAAAARARRTDDRVARRWRRAPVATAARRPAACLGLGFGAQPPPLRRRLGGEQQHAAREPDAHERGDDASERRVHRVVAGEVL